MMQAKREKLNNSALVGSANEANMLLNSNNNMVLQNNNSI